MNENDIIMMIYELAQENAQHIKVLNEEYGIIANNLEWLTRFFWLVTAPIIAAMVGTIYNLMIHRKNSKKMYEIFDNNKNERK